MDLNKSYIFGIRKHHTLTLRAWFLSKIPSWAYKLLKHYVQNTIAIVSNFAHKLNFTSRKFLGYPLLTATLIGNILTLRLYRWKKMLEVASTTLDLLAYLKLQYV